MTRKMYELDSYVLRYDQRKERPWIILVFRVGDKEEHFTWVPPAESAVYIADMLRNEKPVYWSPEGKFLSTSREWVGEEES